jgi:hypothetical protein
MLLEKCKTDACQPQISCENLAAYWLLNHCLPPSNNATVTDPIYLLESIEMRVTLTKPPSTFVEGDLRGIIRQRDAPYAYMVIEMNVTGMDSPVEVTLNELDLFTIVRLAKDSSIQSLSRAVR